MARAAMAAPTVATVLRAPPEAEHLVGCLEMQTASVGSVQAAAVLTARAVVSETLVAQVVLFKAAVPVKAAARPVLIASTVVLLSPEEVAPDFLVAPRKPTLAYMFLRSMER